MVRIFVLALLIAGSGCTSTGKAHKLHSTLDANDAATLAAWKERMKKHSGLEAMELTAEEESYGDSVSAVFKSMHYVEKLQKKLQKQMNALVGTKPPTRHPTPHPIHQGFHSAYVDSSQSVRHVHVEDNCPSVDTYQGLLQKKPVHTLKSILVGTAYNSFKDGHSIDHLVMSHLKCSADSGKRKAGAECSTLCHCGHSLVCTADSSRYVNSTIKSIISQHPAYKKLLVGNCISC